MSRNHDLLFCKIAITNGLINQDVAQKALQLCDKRELETGRRPLIGAIFTKHNLMGKQDVQRLYTAVEKRLGTPAGPQLAAPSRGRGGAKGRRAARAERRGKPTRPVDPRTLWMGIGGLVVFIGILGAILAMILMPSGSDEGTIQAGDVVAEGRTGSGSAGSSLPGAGPGGKAAVGGGGSPIAPGATGPKEIPPDITTQLSEGMSGIMDWRTDPERVAEGLKRLETWAEQLRGKGYEPPEMLTSRIADFRQSMKELGVSEDAGDASPPSDEASPAPETVDPPATEPTTAPAVEPEEISPVDDLESELFGDL
jgi:hypothetical protein